MKKKYYLRSFHCGSVVMNPTSIHEDGFCELQCRSQMQFGSSELEIYICVCVCVYVYMYTHTHTHTHAYISIT